MVAQESFKKIKNLVRLVTINLMQYLINIDWFLRSPHQSTGDAIKIVHHGIRNPPPVPLHSSEGHIFSDGIASHCTATASEATRIHSSACTTTRQCARRGMRRQQQHKFRHQRHCRSLQYKPSFSALTRVTVKEGPPPCL